MIAHTTHRGVRAVSITTRALEAIVPLEFGPRVISLRSRTHGGNLLQELPDGGPAGYEGLLLRGGHRLWHAPEDIVRTYQPDNDPPAVAKTRSGIALQQAAEARTGLQKAMAVELVGVRTIKVIHQLTNRGLWPVETAPWAITMLRPGGTGLAPFPPRGSHLGNLSPGYSIVPWNYTDLSLPEWRFHADFLAIDSAKVTAPQKIGLADYPGWSACWFRGATFVKYAPVVPGAAFPDRGCAFEMYCDPNAIELETLGPLAKLAPGETATHTEWWGVLDDLPKPATDRIWREEFAPAVGQWLRTVR